MTYYIQPKVSARDCDHPDGQLTYKDGKGFAQWNRQLQKYVRPQQSVPAMHCKRCASDVMPVRDEADFVAQREFKFMSVTGLPVVSRDMFGNEIQIGSKVVYPRPGHTMGYGVVEAIDHTKSITDWDRAHRVRVDAPLRIKIAPVDWDSKGPIDYSRRRADGTPKSITLVRGAEAAVVIG